MAFDFVATVVLEFLTSINFIIFDLVVNFSPVFRISRIRKFLRLSDLDPLVRVTDPAPDLPSSSQNSKENRYFYCFVTSL